MRAKVLGFLFLSALFSAGAIGPAGFVPNFSGAPAVLPAGTPLSPLCSNPRNPLCAAEWSQQAMPLSVYSPQLNGLPQAQYFLPAFIPLEFLPNSPEGEEGWERWTPSSSYSRRRRRARSSGKAKSAASAQPERASASQTIFYRSKSDPDKIRMVEIDESGKRVIREKRGGLSPGDSLSQFKLVPEDPEGGKDWERWTPPFEINAGAVAEERTAKTPPRPSQKPRAARGARQPEPLAAEETTAVFYRNTLTNEIARVETDSQGNQIIQSGTVSFISAEDIEPVEEGEPQSAGRHQTAKETLALPAELKEFRPGCFALDKPPETEAGFCFNCERDSLPIRALGHLRDKLHSVTSLAIEKVRNQIIGGNAADPVEKICSSEISLKLIIENFNNNSACAPWDFESFFKKAHCASAQKGVPTEIMMAMMTQESSGNCNAENADGERSGGLFQVDSNQHRCGNPEGQCFNRKTEANFKCLQDPINNLNKSLSIFAEHYSKVNASPINQSGSKSWLDMSHSERDRWRRAVSAYNGGPGWVTRAIESVRRSEDTATSTNFLESAHRQAKRMAKYAKDKMPWEDLRAFYFLEKLSPGNTAGTGRRDANTLSNVAHTEAILGRNVSTPYPPLVDIWAQYLKKNKPSDCPRQNEPPNCPS